MNMNDLFHSTKKHLLTTVAATGLVLGIGETALGQDVKKDTTAHTVKKPDVFIRAGITTVTPLQATYKNTPIPGAFVEIESRELGPKGSLGHLMKLNMSFEEYAKPQALSPDGNFKINSNNSLVPIIRIGGSLGYTLQTKFAALHLSAIAGIGASGGDQLARANLGAPSADGDVRTEQQRVFPYTGIQAEVKSQFGKNLHLFVAGGLTNAYRKTGTYAPQERTASFLKLGIQFGLTKNKPAVQ